MGMATAAEKKKKKNGVGEKKRGAQLLHLHLFPGAIIISTSHDYARGYAAAILILVLSLC